MADLQKTIELIFATKQTGTGIADVGRGLNQLESNVSAVSGPLRAVATDLLQTEAAVITLAAAMAGFAVNEAGQFRTSVTEIGTLFNGTEQQVKGLGDQILEYSRTSTAAIEEINGATYKAISTGTDWAESVELVAAAEVLATAGRNDLISTTDVLTSSLNAYGKSTKDAADFSDILFTAVQTGNTTLPELSASLGKITALGNAAGVPFEDLAAALSALTISAGNTAESSTMMGALLRELIDPSDELTEALGGVTLAGDGVDVVMQRLFEVTQGEASAMTELFGSSRAVQGALVLATDASGAFASAMDAQANRTGNAQKANEALSKSYESINVNLANQFRATVIQIGDELLDSYGGIARALGEVFEGLSSVVQVDSFKPFFDAIDSFGDRAKAQLEGIARALPEALAGLEFDDLLDSLSELGEQVGGVFGDLDLTDPQDLQQAIQFLVDSFETLTRVSASIIDSLQPLFQLFAQLVDEINNTDDGAKEFVGNLLGIGTAVDIVIPALGALGNALTVVGGGLAVLGGAKSAGAAVKGITGLSAALVGGGATTGLVAAAGAAGYAVGDMINGLTELATGQSLSSRLGSWLYDVVHGNEQIAASAQATAEVLRSSVSATDQQTEGNEALADSAKKLSDVINRDQNRSFEEQVELADKNAQIMARLDEINANGAQSTTALAEATEKAAKETKKKTEVEKESESQALKLLQATQDFEIALEKIASDDRQKALEFAFKLDLKALENDAEKAKAIIDGVSNTIDSSAKLIGELFGTMTDENTSRWDQLNIERQIDLENKRRDEAIEMQRDLVTEQANLLQKQAALADARARAIAKGEHLIKVSAEGLTPALEVVFDEIMKYAQVRASQEGAEFLIGLT